MKPLQLTQKNQTLIDIDKSTSKHASNDKIIKGLCALIGLSWFGYYPPNLVHDKDRIVTKLNEKERIKSID